MSALFAFLKSDAPQPFILAGHYSELRFKFSRKIKLIAKSEAVAYGAYGQNALCDHLRGTGKNQIVNIIVDRGAKLL